MLDEGIKTVSTNRNFADLQSISQKIEVKAEESYIDLIITDEAIKFLSEVRRV